MENPFDIAARQIGLNEGDKRAALQDYLTTGGENLDPATTAWCAAFVNATLQQSGQTGTGKLNARSYMDWGQAVDQPQRGDVAVFSRGDPSGWQGHVGFFDGYDDNGRIRVLGGNQGDAVSVASYDPASLLGFRRGGSGMPGQPTQNALGGQQMPGQNMAGMPQMPGQQTAEMQQPFTPQINMLDPRAFQMAPNQRNFLS